ncbi:hypothetical protein EVAR_24899_1 [Eumeta japonica]|uniref:Uncharacterized protein n=1 Tax=Eumeta variegata TaxID=151549 RepID=A0A4C1V8B7_EUMVA|nr:hypothetical protein EVAR_24899_1 [Eumeta japonica]
MHTSNDANHEISGSGTRTVKTLTYSVVGKMAKKIQFQHWRPKRRLLKATTTNLKKTTEPFKYLVLAFVCSSARVDMRMNPIVLHCERPIATAPPPRPRPAFDSDADVNLHLDHSLHICPS